MNIANNPDAHADEDWLMLIKNDKSLAEKSGWAELTTQDWCMLLHEYPDLAEKYNCPFESFTSWDWAELLDHCPQFADKCDLSKLSCDELYLVFSNQPTLIREELIHQLEHRLLDFLIIYPEYIAKYAGDIVAEDMIREIRNIIFENYQVWAKVQIMSMEEAYIAKVVCVDTVQGAYRDIFFRNGKNIIQVDADGKTINETLVKLYACVVNCWREDFTLDFNPPSHKFM